MPAAGGLQELESAEPPHGRRRPRPRTPAPAKGGSSEPGAALAQKPILLAQGGVSGRPSLRTGKELYRSQKAARGDGALWLLSDVEANHVLGRRNPSEPQKPPRTGMHTVERRRRSG